VNLEQQAASSLSVDSVDSVVEKKTFVDDAFGSPLKVPQ